MRRRAPALLPVALAVALWLAGSGAVLVHVLRASDFVMEEVKRHGLVSRLVWTFLAFAPPYLLLGGACAAVAIGLGRLSGRPRAGWGEGIVGSLLLAGTIAATTAYGAVTRPAFFAGYLYDRGGLRRSLQLALERHLDANAMATTSIVAAALLAALAAAGYWRASRRGRYAVAFAALALGLVALVPALDRPPAADPSHPNVLVVLVDSLNPEDIAPESGEPAAPNLARLLEGASRFTDARTPCALTYPSIASLLTSRHPVSHGVRTIYPDLEVRGLPMPKLPEILSRRGFRTSAVSGYCGTVFRELACGFDETRTPRSEADLVLAAAALRGHPWLPIWLDGPWGRSIWPWLRTAVEGSDPDAVAREAREAWRSADGPFFVMAFFDNAHLPYVPVWPESTGAGAYEGRNRYAVVSGDLVEQVREGEGGNVPRADPLERDNVLRLHGAAVRSIDAAVGRMLQGLRDDGLDGATWVVVLADHGENLLRGGGTLAHGEAAEQDRSAHVPWIVRPPGGGAPRTIVEPASMLDVAPTLLDLLGLPAEPGFEGVSWKERLAGGAAPPPRPLLIETGQWFFAREVVDRLDPGGGALAYPSFTEGLLSVEEGDPPHIVIAPQHRQAVLRAKHRRFESGEWALTYVPREGEPRFRLFRRDLDPDLKVDLAAREPETFRAMVEAFRAEAKRLRDPGLAPP